MRDNRRIWQSQRQLSCTSQGTFNIELWIFLSQIEILVWYWYLEQAGEIKDVLNQSAVCVMFSSSYVGNLKGTSKPMHSQKPSTHFWNSWHRNNFNLHDMFLHILNLLWAWLVTAMTTTKALSHEFFDQQTHPFFFYHLSRVVHEALGQPPEDILHLGGDCLWGQGNQIVFLCHFSVLSAFGFYFISEFYVWPLAAFWAHRLPAFWLPVKCHCHHQKKHSMLIIIRGTTGIG